jgi:cell division protein ZapD
VISYEFPINERTRTLLRLEDLYERALFFGGKTHPLEHHAALLAIFELMEVATRGDLKSDLLQELERQKQSLEALRSNPNISESALNSVLNDIESTATRLLESTGKFGQHLRENEWLMAIKQRTTIPGGASEFDLPSYFYWKNLPPARRQQEIEQWMAPLMPIKEGLDIVLRLLRDSAKSFQLLAQRGVFQQMSGGKVVQLLRISLDESFQCIPELSANKYAINVRFIAADGTGERNRVFEHDIPFTLAFCNL